MKLKNITNYGELGTYWRYQLKQSLPAGRKVVFWRNSDTDVKLADDDILHYWGAQGDTAKGTHNMT